MSCKTKVVKKLRIKITKRVCILKAAFKMKKITAYPTFCLRLALDLILKINW